jgi:integrase
MIGALPNFDHAIILAGISGINTKLPPLPEVVRYYDDFADEMHSIRNMTDSNCFTITNSGTTQRFDVSEYGDASAILRHVFVEFIQKLDPDTVISYISEIRKYASRRGIWSLQQLISSSPFDARSHWNTYVLSDITPSESYGLRAMLHSLCRLNIGLWTPSASSIVKGFASPKRDKYRVVRTGECFLPLDQQAIIVSHIDSVCADLAIDTRSIEGDDLREVCMLVLAYQYALRPGQTARVEIVDVKFYNTGAVHVVFYIIKQRRERKRIRVTRRIKREWGPLFNELVKRRENGAIKPKGDVPARLLFGLTPGAISGAIIDLTSELTGEPWTPTDLRHTAAQRQADSGISHAGLTEFLGHSSIRIANVYFDTSPSQAQRVNEALAISPIYSNLARIAKTKTIDKAMLLRLPADQQIGAAPHGIPIAGIGGCNLGQSLCVKNPVLSCYGCTKFLPLNDPVIHEEVLESLRPVVNDFAAASRNNKQSPAYAQLKFTLDAVRVVVEDLKSDSGEARQQ